MPESKNHFYVSPYLENRFQGDAQLFVGTRIFVKNANIKFSYFFGMITWSILFVEFHTYKIS